MKEPMALAEFAAPMKNDDKTDEDTIKVCRNAMRVLNDIAAKTKNGKIPRGLYFTKESFVLRHLRLLIIVPTPEHVMA
jgi:hypothetical protein